MNNNINGNYNLNQYNYTIMTESQHTQMLEHIKQRRAQIIYQIEMEEYNKQADKRAQSDLEAWALSHD
jgi:hypothetical protein